MGAPLPVAGITQPNVLIGALPAARLTDFCACVAPVPVPMDPIILGTPVVLIGGLPATFMGAPTAKGGAIIGPCMPTVLVGFFGMAPPVLPGMPGLPSVAMPHKPGSTSGALEAALTARNTNPICITLGVQAVELAAAQDDAMLASAAYGEPGAPLPANTRRATKEDKEKLGLIMFDQDITQIPGSDFRCDVFVVSKSGQPDSYVVGFKGSTFPPWKSPEDWLTNIKQGFGIETQYYNRAMEVASTINMFAPGTTRYVGHSLGGGMAAAAAAVAKAPARTYNAAGLSASTLKRKSKQLIDAAQVKAYNVDGEILTRLQKTPMLPEAVGTHFALPRVGRSSWLDKTAAAVGGFFGSLLGPLGTLIGSVTAEELVECGRMHMMSEMQSSLAAEADRIAQAREANGCQ